MFRTIETDVKSEEDPPTEGNSSTEGNSKSSEGGEGGGESGISFTHSRTRSLAFWPGVCGGGGASVAGGDGVAGVPVSLKETSPFSSLTPQPHSFSPPQGHSKSGLSFPNASVAWL